MPGAIYEPQHPTEGIWSEIVTAKGIPHQGTFIFRAFGHGICHEGFHSIDIKGNAVAWFPLASVLYAYR